MASLTERETEYCNRIRKTDADLRGFLKAHDLSDPPQTRDWFDYILTMRRTLGNLSNSVSFLATLLAKDYLIEKYRIGDFDAGEKPQGAPGMDISVTTPDGKTIACEIKTTDPYQPGFGAQQKTQIKKDFQKLMTSSADLKIMFVTNEEAFRTLCKASYSTMAGETKIVDLLTGSEYTHTTQ